MFSGELMCCGQADGGDILGVEPPKECPRSANSSITRPALSQIPDPDFRPPDPILEHLTTGTLASFQKFVFLPATYWRRDNGGLRLTSIKCVKPTKAWPPKKMPSPAAPAMPRAHHSAAYAVVCVFITVSCDLPGL